MLSVLVMRNNTLLMNLFVAAVCLSLLVVLAGGQGALLRVGLGVPRSRRMRGSPLRRRPVAVVVPERLNQARALAAPPE